LLLQLKDKICYVVYLCVCRGYKRFFRRALLENSDYLKDDCLKINCTVGVVRSTIDISSLQPIQVPDSDMGSHFGMLLENMEGSDVVFIVAGEKFHAHKLVLTARSPVFRTELFDELMGDKQEIVVTDMEPRVFKVSINFIFLFYFVNHFILNWVFLCCRRKQNFLLPQIVALLHLSCCICFSKITSVFWQKKIKFLQNKT